mmetsp:Transcript_76273/g.215880  ORF Transcript_76273/g.215880 Transcript_76273/m.215880 type:complete len:257 (-) Transcript_76273:519-1289(-)
MVSLAIAMPSFSLSYGMIDRTGPKISSWAMVILLCTSAKTVGLTKYPSSRPAGLPGPPVTRRAPSSMPFLRYPCTRSHCICETNGPMAALASPGRPTTVPSATCFAMSNASWYLVLGTSMRLRALHDCPVLFMSWPMNSGTSFGKSASSSMSAALLPPNSVRTTLRVAAASSVMRFPARVEPVKLIMSTSGCADKVSPQPVPVPLTMLKTPGGSPASWMASARRYALIGVTSLGLRTTVQPTSIAGPILAAIWLRG